MSLSAHTPTEFLAFTY